MPPDSWLIQCRSAGVAFTRGSRRTMLRKGLKRALFSRPGRADSYLADPTTFWALRNVSFSTGPGSIIGLCGNNGSGKTTLLRSISGIYEPDEGQVRTRGRTSVLLSLGATMSANLSGHDNVRMSGAIHGIGRRHIGEHIQRVQDFAELDKQAMETPVRYYSAGMRARLAFASASVLEPDILLVDELLGVGDATFRKKSHARLVELTQSARCVMVASHSARFLGDLCSRVLWLHQGELIQDGPAKEVLHDYQRRGVRPPPPLTPA